MGKSLTFEQSVREAMDLQRNFKCKNPVCETHTWKVKHELDLALLRIDRLQRQLGEHGIPPVPGGMWKDPRDALPGPPPAIGFKPEYLPAPEAGVEPHSSHNGLKGTPRKGVGGILGGPSSSPYPQGDNQIYPVPNKYETKASILPYGTPENSRYQRHYSSTPNKKGSKSLPNSPVKRPLSSSWTRDPFDSGGKLNQPGNQSMKRAQSIPEADPSMIDRKAVDKKTKYHKGHMYQCVPDDPGRVEKETVL